MFLGKNEYNYTFSWKIIHTHWLKHTSLGAFNRRWMKPIQADQIEFRTGCLFHFIFRTFLLKKMSEKWKSYGNTWQYFIFNLGTGRIENWQKLRTRVRTELFSINQDCVHFTFIFYFWYSNDECYLIWYFSKNTCDLLFYMCIWNGLIMRFSMNRRINIR